MKTRRTAARGLRSTRQRHGLLRTVLAVETDASPSEEEALAARYRERLGLHLNRDERLAQFKAATDGAPQERRLVRAANR